MDIRIEPLTLPGLAEVLADHEQFWDGRDTRFLHQQVFVQEFRDTCLAARGPDGRVTGYLIGFTTPRRIGYIHAVAVRAQARRTGCAEALYRAFAAAAAAQGADQLKAITTVANAGSVAFHRRLDFGISRDDNYGGPGMPRVVMTRELPLPEPGGPPPRGPRPWHHHH
jgi:ribosomal protein S18 acetylase RimI-like enzyme